ncbi:hypothetical protein J9303_20050 [Bacillaceae bacterium Marseille-Q3522]|nr:hypothetical protein [Bacillaceae bacterium Marseille-Q3522]
MKNYGEEIAYWYLRFNGFFVLDNYIYQNNRDGDADLLAIRLPHVVEPIGGKLDDWDEELFGNQKGYDILGLLCEVKTGQDVRCIRAFENRKVNTALKRIGFSKLEVEELLNQNENNSILNYNKKNFIKLVVTESKIQTKNDTYLTIPLKHVEEFIYKRVRNYIGPKYNTRHFFPSSLIQYIMYREKKRSGIKQ